ncbi:MAG: hypothetical protein HZB91_05750 [Elusimicrobia bacterium]|nr:hypothetical protein [Elusimicrobiota bacterium]
MRGLILVLALAAGRPASGQDDFAGYAPASERFSCEAPADWAAFEEEELSGSAVHLLGPDDRAGAYRTGIDVHFVDASRPGFIPAKTAIENLRRSDKLTRRESTPVKRFAVGKGLARTFEVWEKRSVPSELSPSVTLAIHHFVAVIESGESYFVIRLSSAEELYVDLRKVFVRFLKSFRAKEA